MSISTACYAEGANRTRENWVRQLRNAVDNDIDINDGYPDLEEIRKVIDRMDKFRFVE